MPLFLRLSATDWLDYEGSPVKESWTIADSVCLAPLLVEYGVDLVDVSSGGNHPAPKITTEPGYQAPFAKAIKKAVGDSLAVGTVGTITSGNRLMSIWKRVD
jgi:2,4-dienoyl-CoA reductase-like NADH-dependent reductase (Old Yellow Enzyme family)